MTFLLNILMDGHKNAILIRNNVDSKEGKNEKIHKLNNAADDAFHNDGSCRKCGLAEPGICYG